MHLCAPRAILIASDYFHTTEVRSHATQLHLLHDLRTFCTRMSAVQCFIPAKTTPKAKGCFTGILRMLANIDDLVALEHYKCSPRVLFWFSCDVRSMIIFLCQFAMDYPRWMILQMTNPNPTVSAASIACIYVVSMYRSEDHLTSRHQCTDQYCDNFSRLFPTLPLRSYWSL